MKNMMKNIIKIAVILLGSVSILLQAILRSNFSNCEILNHVSYV